MLRFAMTAGILDFQIVIVLEWNQYFPGRLIMYTICKCTSIFVYIAAFPNRFLPRPQPIAHDSRSTNGW